MRCIYTGLDYQRGKKDIYTLFSDSYDVLAASGVFVPSHAKEDCFLELIRILKPGNLPQYNRKPVDI